MALRFNVRDLLAERNVDVSARSVLNWVQKFGLLLAEEARRRARPLTGRRGCSCPTEPDRLPR
ncbi:MAG TPA: hypothetical protein VGP96_05340 [Candidatus Dormibacteraeota bacterium]|nr:hypothetical protein [Candidatus Dormibacteraeota bacterium]